MAGQSDNGSRLARIWRNGYSGYTAYGYNARNWITAVRNRLTGGATMYDADYYYSDGALWDHTGNPLKQVETYGGSDYTTTLRYDSVYRQTEETKRDSQSNVLYSVLYGYDAAGNRISETRDGQELTFTYDDNNKLTYVSATSPTASATMQYDNAGNSPEASKHDPFDSLGSLRAGLGHRHALREQDDGVQRRQPADFDKLWR